jgi:hypothetical protein
MIDPARDLETARRTGLSTKRILANCDAEIDRLTSKIAELAKASSATHEHFAFVFQEILNVVSTKQYVLARSWHDAERTNFQSLCSCKVCKTRNRN